MTQDHLLPALEAMMTGEIVTGEMTTGDQLIKQFEDGTTPAATFHHADHVRLAFEYLYRYPALEALEKFSAALRRFAAAQGKPQLYHETITWAYLLLIRERMARAGRVPDLGRIRRSATPICSSGKAACWQPSTVKRRSTPTSPVTPLFSPIWACDFLRSESLWSWNFLTTPDT